MKAKLIKEEEGYYVYVNTETIGTTRPLLNFDLVKYKLSLKNCQAIERGYDLDELLKKEIANGKLHPNDGAKKEGIERGIQIALEIFGDKKFSEDDVIKIAEYVRVASQSTPNVRTKDLFDEYQSLQQTEWDVEIEMVPAMSNNGNVYYGDIPKLDADGCLILK